MTVNVPELFLKNIALLGTNVGNLPEYRAMLAFVEQHRLRPVIDRAFGFDAAADALTYLDGAHRFGKVTIAR
jgi:zinc-binding alcohol dehydrogenase/oxidoreductase